MPSMLARMEQLECRQKKGWPGAHMYVEGFEGALSYRFKFKKAFGMLFVTMYLNWCAMQAVAAAAAAATAAGSAAAMRSCSCTASTAHVA